MSWVAAPTGWRGRQQTYSDAAVQTCLTMKVLFGMALRQTTGFVESLLQLIGFDWSVTEMLGQIPTDEAIGSVTADGAYDTRKCHDAIADRGAHAVIPSRRNAKPWKAATTGAVARNEALRASKHVGRALWRRWSGYHRRSRVESKMHCVKLRGQRLMARDFDRQVAELHVRIAVLNGYAALGIPVTEVVGKVRPRKGAVGPSADLCNRVRSIN